MGKVRRALSRRWGGRRGDGEGEEGRRWGRRGGEEMGDGEGELTSLLSSGKLFLIDKLLSYLKSK